MTIPGHIRRAEAQGYEYDNGGNMKLQIVKHADRKAQWMTAERTLFVTLFAVAIRACTAQRSENPDSRIFPIAGT